MAPVNFANSHLFKQKPMSHDAFLPPLQIQPSARFASASGETREIILSGTLQEQSKCVTIP
jgi:hypothetical protein